MRSKMAKGLKFRILNRRSRAKKTIMEPAEDALCQACVRVVGNFPSRLTANETCDRCGRLDSKETQVTYLDLELDPSLAENRADSQRDTKTKGSDRSRETLLLQP
eukprot:Gregarina_sp_Poly_1__2264@NODE_1600_length_3746_cov_138_343028_g1054_i0_p4_GENE_NODE_1600_length_3746_cov_138_343028_g1054_i0NODE_1600_length_3746_cov_138_343028_g1054_i0_p4_ORF_typecomplete_len105_score15_70znribbon_14/PF16503_5/10znribbon_14/PF16503_5/11_NODE_1600_length_3746_cov_138_343028_g1054_i027713085